MFSYKVFMKYILFLFFCVMFMNTFLWILLHGCCLKVFYMNTFNESVMNTYKKNIPKKYHNRLFMCIRSNII